MNEKEAAQVIKQDQRKNESISAIWKNVIIFLLCIAIAALLICWRMAVVDTEMKEKELRRGSVSFLSDFVDHYILESPDEYTTLRQFHKESYYELFLYCGIDSFECDRAVWYVSDTYPDEILMLHLNTAEARDKVIQAYENYAYSKYLPNGIDSVKVEVFESGEYLGFCVLSQKDAFGIDEAFDNAAEMKLHINGIHRAWMYYFSF